MDGREGTNQNQPGHNQTFKNEGVGAGGSERQKFQRGSISWIWWLTIDTCIKSVNLLKEAHEGGCKRPKMWKFQKHLHNFAALLP